MSVGEVPPDALLVGIWTLAAEVGAIEEAAFYERAGDTARLWVVQGEQLRVHYGAQCARSLVAARRASTQVIEMPAVHPDHYQAWCLVDRLFRERPKTHRIREWGRGCLLGWRDFADLGVFRPSREFLTRVGA